MLFDWAKHGLRAPDRVSGFMQAWKVRGNMRAVMFVYTLHPEAGGGFVSSLRDALVGPDEFHHATDDDLAAELREWHLGSKGGAA